MELNPGFKQTHAGILPEAWQCVSLGSIATVGSGGTPSRDNVRYWNGGIPWVTTSQVDFGRISSSLEYISEAGMRNSAAKLLPPGTLLLALYGQGKTRGKVAMLEFEACTNQACASITVRADASNEYLFHFLSGQYERLRNASNSGSQENLSGRLVKQFPVALPPLEEQRAIAAALSDVDALVAALDRLIAKKRDLKQAAMQQLLTGQTRLPGFTEDEGLVETEVGLVPRDWKVRNLLSALHIANGQVDPRREPFRSMTLVAPDHIESGTGRLLARETAVQQGAISGKYIFAEGDIVYSKIRPYLRKAIVATFDGLCSADMYPLRPAEGVHPNFMLAVLLGHRFSRFAESVSVRSGMPKINRTELSEYVLALPSYSEQRDIARVLSDIDAEIDLLLRRRDKTKLLKQGMMQELLTGRTRLV